METFLILSRQDFRTTYRDPLFKGLLVFPFVAFAIIRWGLPLAIGMFPAVEPCQVIILAWACMQAATMFGMIYGFLFLEEKEENVLEVLRIMPVSLGRLLASRLFLGFAVSVLVNLSLLHFGQIVRLPVWQEILIALQFSLMAPFIALLLGAFARNRIEGLAQMKIVNLGLILPGLIYFLPSKWLHLTALVPSYWSFRSLEAAVAGAGFWLYYGVGSLVYLGMLTALNLRFTQNKAN